MRKLIQAFAAVGFLFLTACAATIPTDPPDASKEPGSLASICQTFEAAVISYDAYLEIGKVSDKDRAAIDDLVDSIHAKSCVYNNAGALIVPTNEAAQIKVVTDALATVTKLVIALRKKK